METKLIGRTMGAEVLGVDLARPADAGFGDAVERALADYGVLVFRDQKIGDDEQQAFIQIFGPPLQATLKELVLTHPHFVDIGSVDAEGKPLDPKSAQGMYMRANALWHTDGSQLQPPVRITALHARTLPSSPPPTEYADMRAAWADLPASEQQALASLQVVHDIRWSREQIGMKAGDFSAESLEKVPPVVHPLVRTHPIGGRKSLYLASHASHVVGMPLQEGRALIARLMQHATQEKFVYAHRWKDQDLVMWDDRWTMHRATEYTGGEPRKLRWCCVRETEAV